MVNNTNTIDGLNGIHSIQAFFSDVFAEAIASLMKEHNVTDDDIAFYAFNQLSNAQNQETLTKNRCKNR